MTGSSLGAPSLGSVARAGARWQSLAQATEVGLGLAILIYLARIVDAKTFGVVSLALAIAALLSALSISPITSAVIARRLTGTRELSTSWWLVFLPGLGTAVLIVLVEAVLGVRGREGIALAVVAASVPVLSCATLVQAILQQRLAFRAAAFGRIVSAMGSSALALGLGLHGLGFAALLSRPLFAPLLILFIGLPKVRWWPRPVIDRTTLRGVIAYARGVSGFNALNQLNRYADNLLVGLILGPSALGYYSLAYRFIETPVNQVSGVVHSVVFPIVVHVEDEMHFRQILLRSQKVLVGAVAPLCVCSIAVGDLAVRTILGAQWATAGLIVQLFGAIALLQTANALVGVVYLARDKTELFARWAAIATPVIVSSFAIGLLGGVHGVALAYAAANILLFYPNWYFPDKIIGLSAAMVLKNLKIELLTAYALGGGVLIGRHFVELRATQSVIIAAMVLMCVYVAIVLSTDGALRADVITMVGRQDQAKGGQRERLGTDLTESRSIGDRQEAARERARTPARVVGGGDL
jgi:lipopolysaccharide exporter